MNAEQMMERAKQVRDQAVDIVRSNFQSLYPHYSPKPGASMIEWQDWEDANVELHGREGFYSRFHPYKGTNPRVGQHPDLDESGVEYVMREDA